MFKGAQFVDLKSLATLHQQKVIAQEVASIRLRIR